MEKRSKLFIALATGGYIGFIPFAPGTFGSLPGILFFFLLSSLSLLTGFFLIIAFILLSIWIAGKGEESLQANDPGCIVIDEIAGMAVTFFAIPFSLFSVIIGFIVFRFFDILKPFPVGYLEKRFSGGLGVVMDDVAAGIMSNIVLQGVIALVSLH